MRQGDIFRLIEGKDFTLRTAQDAGLKPLKTFVFLDDAERATFNVDYFIRERSRELGQEEVQRLFRNGNRESLNVRVLVNSPESAEVASFWRGLIGGEDIIYRFEGAEHTIRLQIIPVSR